MAEIELSEGIDEFELAKYRRMAIDAISGHFPIHTFGDQSHIEVLAKALERCVDALEYDNAEEVVDEAKGKIEDLEAELDKANGKLQRIAEMVCKPDRAGAIL